ncbi:MAG: hypothetical protein U5L96_11155 [Owenweeksia sp.]|nr:hypothetical protein [Owenweeksia sp.]
MVYWAIRLKRKILLPIIVLSIGFLHLQRTYQFGQARREVADNSSLKVMSFNLRLLNLYDWLEDDQVPEKITDLIRRENPDVLLLQEYHNKRGQRHCNAALSLTVTKT